MNVLHESSISFLAIKLLKLHNVFEHNTVYLMSCPTGVLLLRVLQQLELDLRGNATYATGTFAERCGLRG